GIAKGRLFVRSTPAGIVTFHLRWTRKTSSLSTSFRADTIEEARAHAQDTVRRSLAGAADSAAEPRAIRSAKLAEEARRELVGGSTFKELAEAFLSAGVRRG